MGDCHRFAVLKHLEIVFAQTQDRLTGSVGHHDLDAPVFECESLDGPDAYPGPTPREIIESLKRYGRLPAPSGGTAPPDDEKNPPQEGADDKPAARGGEGD